MSNGNAPNPASQPRFRWSNVSVDTGLASPSDPPLFASQMHQIPEDRKQLIFRIRRQIAENRYDSPDKMRIALERMLDLL